MIPLSVDIKLFWWLAHLFLVAAQSSFRFSSCTSSPPISSPRTNSSSVAVANVCPGPMFNIAAFLGGLIGGGYTGALTAWLALFTPGVLMQFGALPFWAIVRHNGKVRKVLTGVNAAAAGLMAAAVVIIWVTIVTSMQRAGLTVALIGGREIVKLPAYNVIMIGMVASAIFYFGHIPF
eukprot:GEMP01110697.1.p1 GENE.GEMP01110697.1~~GEMP01110697.1.p1  ORF type:complete len:178 (-),score=39.00 GEMP01110697.1:90-623(-)